MKTHSPDRVHLTLGVGQSIVVQEANEWRTYRVEALHVLQRSIEVVLIHPDDSADMLTLGFEKPAHEHTV